MFREALVSKIAASRVVPVIIINDPEKAAPLGDALLAGGLQAAEITFRTEHAATCIRRMAEGCPELLVGAGTILDANQVNDAKEAGAQFAVSPGLSLEVIATADNTGLPLAPGIMTPGEVTGAIQSGCKVLKFFPAESAGGPQHLKSIAAPFKHLGLKYIPTGGITAASAPSYLEIPGVIAVGGSWVAPPALIEAGDWAQITQIAKAASQL